MRRLATSLALTTTLATGATLSAPSAGAQGDDRYTAPRNATVEASNARRVEVEAAAGSLRILGVSGLSEVRVRGTARASREAWLDDIRLVARREGDVVVVRAEIPDLRDDRGWENGHRGLDLVIEVPRGIAARVSDGSGEVEIRGVGALDVHDGSGELEIDDVASVVVEDGSGEIRIRNVQGDVRVADGSGSIEVERVRGAVIVERDGSGGVDVRDVRGDFTVERGRGRGIRYADVGGRVTVPRSRRY